MKDKIWIFILSTILFCVIIFSIEHEIEQQATIVALCKLVQWQDEVISDMDNEVDTYSALILREYVERESD